MKKIKAAFLLVVFVGAMVLAAQYLHGHTVAVLSPQGPIAKQQRDLIVIATLVMLIVVIPVFVLLFTFAWKYRAGNTKARYTPDWDRNSALETSWWAIPTVIIIALAVVAWKSSHTLDPYKPITASVPTMTIQAVALDWKWLFIYPQQHIATVNYVEMPVNTPVDFQITADAPMNSFWIPQLGGQIYAMPGMSTHLNLMASSLGSFRGSSANISGDGFAGMSFTATSMSHADFEKWVNATQGSSNKLSLAAYKQLAKPSESNPTAAYTSPQADLFTTVIGKYMAPASKMPGMDMSNMNMP